MWMQIVHALQCRSQAIKNAVKDYNNAARNLNPPKPPLDWEHISHYKWLQDFVLLRETDPDVLKQPWADPVVRFTMKQHLRIQRAREEINRCNVEIRRLHTHIVDEGIHLDSVLERVQKDEVPSFAFELEGWIVKHKRINEKIMWDIQKVYGDGNYSGDRTPGVRMGTRLEAMRDAQLDKEIVFPYWGGSGDEHVSGDGMNDGGEMVEDEDEEQDQANGLIQYMSELVV